MNMLIWNWNGAVKVTPAHDGTIMNGSATQAGNCNIFNPDATTNKNVPDWLQGLTPSKQERKLEWFEQNG
jgi:hypothetical protein